MQSLENTLFRKERTLGSSDASRIHCSAPNILHVEIEATNLDCARRSKSFELTFKDNEKVLWVCGSEESCWIVSLCTSEKVFKEHNQYKIYKMEETGNGLKVRQELEVHEPVLQGIQTDDDGRLLYPSQSKKCVRYVTCKNIIHTLLDVDEKYDPCVLYVKHNTLFVLNRDKDTKYLITKIDTDRDEINFDDEEIDVHLDQPRRLFLKEHTYPYRFAILHDGLTVYENGSMFNDDDKVLFTVSSGSGNSELRDVAVNNNSFRGGILLAYPNGIVLVDWKCHHQKRIYETADNITTISLSGENLWIGHDSNTIEMISVGELEI